MSGVENGLKLALPPGAGAAVAAALERAGAARPAVPPEQLPLLEVAAPAEPAPAAPPPGERSRGGRPPGAKNRRTEEWTEYLLSRYRSPLVVLAETYSRPVEVLAAELGITRAEAFKMQLTAARELAPYVHERQAIAVKPTGGAAVALILSGVEPPAGDEGEGEDPIIDVTPTSAESEADQ